MSEELRPCPLCGWEFAEHAWNEFGEEYRVCDQCGASSGTVDSKRDWQSRPIEDELRKRITELEAECEQLRRGIHDETVPEKYEENVAKLQKEFSMRFENESPVEFYRTIRSGQYPQPPEVQE